MTGELAGNELASIQARFHELILRRAVDEYGLKLEVPLPVLSPDPRDYAERLWFSVPGMYGGFAYQLVVEDDAPVLLTESWCRVAEGSDQAHRISESATELVAEGFA